MKDPKFLTLPYFAKALYWFSTALKVTSQLLGQAWWPVTGSDTSLTSSLCTFSPALISAT